MSWDRCVLFLCAEREVESAFLLQDGSHIERQQINCVGVRSQPSLKRRDPSAYQRGDMRFFFSFDVEIWRPEIFIPLLHEAAIAAYLFFSARRVECWVFPPPLRVVKLFISFIPGSARSDFLLLDCSVKNTADHRGDETKSAISVREDLHFLISRGDQALKEAEY